MSDIYISSINDAYVKLNCANEMIAQDLSSFFSFDQPGAHFSKQFRAKMWDGKVRLYNVKSGMIYKGLIKYIVFYAETNDLTVTMSPDLINSEIDNRSADWVNKFAAKLQLTAGGKSIIPRDFQASAVEHVINNERALVVSPTASGKSLIIYMLLRYYLALLPSDKKVLIIVPTTSLVAQMLGDFGDYASSTDWDALDRIHCIYKGASKNSSKRLYISTWQSIYKEDKSYFKQFGAVFGDEAHQFKAKNIGGILEKCANCRFRIGLTGTVGDRDAPVHKLQLEGLFGPQYTTITTKELMNRGQVAKLDINLVKLGYDIKEARLVKSMTYQEEIQYIIGHAGRNAFLLRLSDKLKKTTMFLFQKRVHGQELHRLMVEKYGNTRNIYLWHGGIDSDVRNKQRMLVETDPSAIIIASYGTTAEGVSIKNLFNVVFASPYKSELKVIQSIGRGLRVSDNKILIIGYRV